MSSLSTTICLRAKGPVTCFPTAGCESRRAPPGILEVTKPEIWLPRPENMDMVALCWLVLGTWGSLWLTGSGKLEPGWAALAGAAWPGPRAEAMAVLAGWPAPAPTHQPSTTRWRGLVT